MRYSNGLLIALILGGAAMIIMAFTLPGTQFLLSMLGGFLLGTGIMNLLLYRSN